VAREEERRAEAKMVRGEVERMDRLLKARLPSGELKRGKSFRRKARRDQEDKEAVNMSALTSCMDLMVTTLSPIPAAKRYPQLTFK